MMQQSSTQERIWSKSFISLTVTQFILFTVFYSLLTTLPIYVIDNLGESQSNAGLVVTLMLASAIIVRPFSAKVLDILGKKNSLVISIGLFTLTTFLYLSIHSFIPLLILRFIHGISFSIVTTTTSSIAAEIIPKSRRGEGMGYFAMAMNLAVVAGPFIALSLLQYISFKTLFLVLSILMVVSVIFSLFVQVREQQINHDQERASMGLKLTDLIERKAIPIALISGLVGIAYASVLSYVPVYAEEVGLAATASYFFLVFALVMIVFRPYLGRTFDQKGAKIVLVPSLVIFALGLTVLGFTTFSVTLLIAAGLIGLGYGTLLPGFQTLAIQSTTSDRSGHALSTFFIFYDLGIAAGAVLWGLVIAGFSFESMYFIGASLVLITAGILYLLLTKQEKVSRMKQNSIR